jgi:hypothetical protein
MKHRRKSCGAQCTGRGRQTDGERGGEDDCSAQDDGFQFRAESCRMESDRSAQNDRLIMTLLL